jgi:3-phytase
MVITAVAAMVVLHAGQSAPRQPRRPPTAAPPSPPALVTIASVRATAPVAHDPDDPAIWRHPTDLARSLVLGTDKFAVDGALYVFGLDGAVRQVITPLDRPNNVDVEYGVRLGSRVVDVAVVTERKQHRLRIFAIPADGGLLTDLAPGGLPVLQGMTGLESEPMGVALYKRASDGAVFAIVAPKIGGSTDYLWQYQIEADPDEAPRLRQVRRFGNFSGLGPTPGEPGEVEAVVVDDEMGFVYYSDERFGIRKWQADPNHADAGRELAVFGRDGYLGDREGLAIYPTGPGRGYLVSSDQLEGATRLRVYRREGVPGNPHAHVAVSTLITQSDGTDGLDVTSAALPGFPRGLLVMMNSGAKNFLLYRWEDVVR